jgi:NADH-quinone oxidoreductase subunit G
MSGYVTVDGRQIPIEGEKNLLALIRKAGIDIPTFCYHSELSTYGACRLCLVEINGKEIDASCVVPPKDGMSVRTSTPRIRSMRKLNLELLLANHKQDCPTCIRSESCRLRDLSAKMGIASVRFRRTREELPLDLGSPSLVRDPNKCILCGDCVRYCSEIQGIGAIDFAHRGSDVRVTPAFGKSLGEVDCVNCGQCAAVCPTGAIVPRSSVGEVWKALDDEKALVVAQVAPAVRAALGERFGLSGADAGSGKIATALRMLGFDLVYDTAFGADLTVVEEATELLGRRAAAKEAGSPGSRLPIFTSCCPAWVKFAEQSFPELLPKLSSCMSPQSMMGSVIRESEGARAKAAGKALRVVSIMPCTAKKYEIGRPELSRDDPSGGRTPLVDHVLTTAELAGMIDEAGIRFAELEPSPMDQPLGFSSGAGIVFGNSGGVSEAVARYLAPRQGGGGAGDSLRFAEEAPGVRKACIGSGDGAITILAVQGLGAAKKVAREILSGARVADLVEVMACPGGCIGGAGQPVCAEPGTRAKRAQGIREADAARELPSTRDNPFVDRFYAEIVRGEPGGAAAKALLHTRYSSKKRIADAAIPLVRGSREKKVEVKVCVGTSCFVRGSQALLSALLERIEAEALTEFVDVSATFCRESCDKGPTVVIGSTLLHKASLESSMAEVQAQIKKISGSVSA